MRTLPATHPMRGHDTVRQVRHLMKNALQRLIAEISRDKSLRRSQSGRALASRLEDRIMLTAEIANTLFGFTRAPAPMHARMESLCDSVLRLMGDPDQLLTLDINVRGEFPETHACAVLRITHELVGNAVKHGMQGRMLGRIEVWLHADAGRTVLDVRDDGWGCLAHAVDGEGLSLARGFAEALDGTVRLRRAGDMTIVTTTLPQVTRAA